jgi:hypothetical protein
MRNRILGAIGVLWGAGILVSALLRDGAQGSGAYAAGQTTALVFAVLLVAVGGYYLLKGRTNRLQSVSHRHRNIDDDVPVA